MLRITLLIMLLGLTAVAGWCATVRVTKAQSGTAVTLATGDTLEVALPADHHPGYAWHIVRGNENLLRSLGAPEFSTTPSGAGEYTFRFFAVNPGAMQLALAFRPVNRPTPVTANFRMTVRITGEPQYPRITLEAGQVGVGQGKAPLNGTDRRVISLQAGQTLRVALAPLFRGDAILIIFGADGTVLISDHAEARYFEGTVPTTQDYNIDIRPAPNTSPEYRLLVAVTPAPEP